MLSSAEQKRRDELARALAKYGLPLRFDSRLAQDYIFQGVGTIALIVRRQCEAKFLHEYCDYARGFCNAQASKPWPDMSRSEWLFHVRMCVLATVHRDGFPAQWPWLSA